MRLFFALVPPPSTVAALAAVATAVRCGQCRAVPPANFHVTLTYVGRVDAAAHAACERAAQGVRAESFVLAFASSGWFERARVAWLGVTRTPDALAALVAALRAALDGAGVAYDRKAFRCHLSIAREVRVAPQPARVPAVAWSVREFALVESVSDGGGVRYVTRAKWPLRPACRDETTPSPVQ